MKRILLAGGLALVATAVTPLRADERTARIEVGNIYCASCPYIVRSVLEQVPGVAVEKMAYVGDTTIEVVVRYEDETVSVEDLVAATDGVGFPARPVR